MGLCHSGLLTICASARMGVLVAGSALVLAGCDASTPARPPTGQTETEQVAAAALAVGDAEEAARLYERAAQKQPDSVTALLGLGRSYAALGQFGRAASALSRARELKPHRTDVQTELGRLALVQGDAATALPFFQAALRLAPRDLSALTGQAVALDYLSRHAEAQQVYQLGLRYYPTNFALLSNQALSRVLSGDAASGIAQLEQLLGDANHGETIRANLAIAYALQGRVADARAMLKGILDPEETRAALALYATARTERQAGHPIGHLVFR